MDDDALATLARWVPFDFSAQYVNRVDAAIAGPITKAECRAEIALIGLIPRGVKPVTDGMKVQKVGRTTHATWGKVKDTHFRTALTYPHPVGGKGKARFLDQVLCTRYTRPGDSGALVLDEDGYAVGLHVCGAPLASIFSPIQFVLDALDVDLVTQPL